MFLLIALKSKRDAHRHALKMRHGVAQTRIWRETRSCSDPRLKWNAELLKPAFEVKRGVAQIRIWSPCFTLGREVRVLVETWPSRWSEIRIWELVFKWFLNSLQNPSKVFETPRLIGMDFGILWTPCWLRASHDWTGNRLRCLDLYLAWISIFMSVLLNCLKPPRKIIMSILETQSGTCISFDLFIGVLLNL